MPFNDEILGTPDDDILIGTDFGEDIFGGTGNDVLTGGHGNDFLHGGDGVDIARFIGNASEYTFEGDDIGGGLWVIDTDFRDGDYLDDIEVIEFDDVTYTVNTNAASGAAIYGDENNNLFSASPPDWIFNEMPRAFRLYGQAGDDLYRIGPGMIVLEDENGGIDTVEIRGDYTLPDNIENVIGGNGTLVGNGLDNRFIVGAGIGTIDGEEGFDSVVIEQSVIGFRFVHEGSEVRISDDSTPWDESSGVVAHFSYSFLYPSFDYNLGSIEQVQFDNAQIDISLDGNSVVLQGSAISERIDCSASPEGFIINGMAGEDDLWGGWGDDVLNGGSERDLMFGDLGDDRYYVDEADDVVAEWENEGNDSVYSTCSFTLSDDVESLYLQSAAGAASGTGNETDNTLIGNGAANVLYGKGGIDWLNGYADNDILIAGSGNDRLIGDAGNDKLIGEEGNDTLTGGAGSDYFRFNTALNKSTNVDRITDFSTVYDFIQLENSVFTKLGAAGTLSSAAFRKGANLTHALDGNDFIIYNTTTGDLYYDRDGDAGHYAPIKFAVLSGSPDALSNADFLVI